MPGEAVSEATRRAKIIEWIVESVILIIVFVIIEPLATGHLWLSVLLVALLVVAALLTSRPKKRWVRLALGAVLACGCVFGLAAVLQMRSGAIAPPSPIQRATEDIGMPTGAQSSAGSAANKLPSASHAALMQPSAKPAVAPRPSGGSSVHDVEVQRIDVGDNGAVHVGNVAGAGSASVGIGSIRAGSGADISIGNKTP